ncbi:MAG: hypothetical protein FWD36_08275 [Treponema sp.]|nr:hypothetical protein [Treponema sp.]
MKTKIALLAILVVGAVSYSACVGLQDMGVLDDSIPEEKRCYLQIRDNLAVILYNNQPVEWKPALTKNKISIVLPPGESTFMVQYYVSGRDMSGFSTTQMKTATVNMEFIPGRSYRIYKQNIWLVFFTLTNIKIKDVTPKGFDK